MRETGEVINGAANDIFCALALVAGSALGHAANSKGSLNPTEKLAAVNSVRQNVLAYLKSLPGYTSTLTVRHTARPPNAVNDPSIQSIVVEERVNALNGKEIVSPSPGMLTHDSGNLIGIIFDPETGADLRWDHTATIDHRKVDAVAFHVPVSAGYFLTGNGGTVQSSFEGFVCTDTETHAVIRIQMKCTMIPDASSIRAFSLTLDYKPVQLDGREFILPSHFLLQAMDSAQDRQIYDDGRYSNYALAQPR